MPEHLNLPEPRPVGSRRAGGGGGSAPVRDRGKHGRKLRNELKNITTHDRADGIDPSLVFKIRATGRPSDINLSGNHLHLLGETAEYTYFVLTDDNAQALDAAIASYMNTGQGKSFVGLINDIEAYGPDDRRGPGLEQHPETPLFLVDITIWASNTFAEAQRRANVVDRALRDAGGESVLRSVGTRRNLIRARVSAAILDALLNVDVIEQIRTPPVPFLDYRDWRDATPGDLTRVTVDSAEVGVLDDAPALHHPLLEGLILSVDPMGHTDYPWQPLGHHGTEVVGRVLFPGLHEQLRDQTTITAHGTVRIARVLEPNPNDPTGAPRFCASGFPHQLIEQGIRHLHDTYGVRIFNLSLGFSEPYSSTHLDPLTEMIDELVRELRIVVVVPTGNVGLGGHPARTPSGHHVGDDYPTYLGTLEHRIAEPGPAALAITVGSLALSDGIAEISSRRLGWQAVADVNEPSPFSRTGPGIGISARRRNKPDVAHYGGNTALNEQGSIVPNELGSSIVSTSLDPISGRIFAACNGTSFAAPAVARVAADIAHAYPDASANLIRALLAVSSTDPNPDSTTEDHHRATQLGYGVPDTNRAITSGARRATMIYDGAIPVDTVHLHAIPLPEMFRRGNGHRRSVTVSLAFDPPVRRQRREYLAASIQLDLYRNVEFDDLQDILRRQDTERLDTITDNRRPPLKPSSDALGSSTLQVRHWTPTKSFVDDNGIFYVAVTHKTATWIRDDPRYRWVFPRIVETSPKEERWRWRHGGSSIRSSRKARCGLSGRRASRSRRWPGSWVSMREPWATGLGGPGALVRAATVG